MKQTLEEVKRAVIELLENTERKGIGRMIEWLNTEGFFTSPASTRFHGAFPGGLASHSLGVYKMLRAYNVSFQPNAGGGRGQKALPVTNDTIAIAALLHDVCKVGTYIGDVGPYTWNRSQPKGHAILSLLRIKHYLVLEPLETMLVLYHMGVYGLNGFYGENERQKGEYPLRGDSTQSQEERYGASMANAWYHNPIVKLMYFCDELESFQAKAM